MLAIAVDRQEVAIDSREAIAEYQEKTGTRVVSVVNAVDVYNVLKEGNLAPEKALERLANYIRVYGTKDARAAMGRGLEQRVIGRDRSVIPACDVETLEQFEELVRQTADIEGISAYKIGFELGLGYGLSRVVETARKHTDKQLIYDHQKAGTDIPDTGKNFARVCKKAGVDTVILFPQAGPETERAWIYHALNQKLNVIIGGKMTHEAYAVSEGGFITDKGILSMYRIAAQIGIRDYVVPGNKPEAIRKIKEVIEAEGVSPSFYAPGFVAQGGRISETAKVAGERFHGIVGREIYESKDMKQAAIEHTSQLN
jgi:orotidine-5'-phosphate decarboxylase